MFSNEGGFLTTTVDAVVNWARSNSLMPMPLGLSCCAIEMMAFAGPRYDVARFGSEAMRFSPRQADLMIVAGWCTYKMAHAIRRIWDQMADPKWCIAMGVCASAGGPHRVYGVVQGVDNFLPVDVYVPGCPPRPEAVLHALLDIQEKIRREQSIADDLRDRGEPARLVAREDGRRLARGAEGVVAPTPADHRLVETA